MKPGAILATNTSTLDIDEIAAATTRPAGRDRHAFLQPGERHAAARGRARREDLARRRSPRVMKLAKTLRQDRRGVGRVRRLHRQPHDRALPAAGEFPARRRRAAAAGGQGAARTGAWRWGRSPCPTSPASTSAGTSASAARVERPDFAYSRIPDRLCELGRFGQKTGAGFYRYEKGSRAPLPDPVVDEADRRLSRAQRHQAPRDRRRRKSSSAASSRWSTRARASSKKASRCARSTSTWSTSPATAFRAYRGGPMFYADTVGLEERHRRDGRSTRMVIMASAGRRRRCSRSWPPKAKRSAGNHERQETSRPHRQGRARHRRLARPRAADRRGAGRNGREARAHRAQGRRARGGAHAPRRRSASRRSALACDLSQARGDRADGRKGARALRQDRHPGQQRRHHLGRARRGASAGGLAEAGRTSTSPAPSSSRRRSASAR